MSLEPDLEAKAQETTAIVEQASQIVIKDAESYKHAVELRGRCKQFMDYFESLFRPRISEADKLHKNLLADLKRLKAPPEREWYRIGLLLSEFDRKAQQEKERLEREAERKRRDEEAKQRELAKLAEELGSTETAAEIEETPIDPGPIIKKGLPQVEGLHYRHGGWSWTIEDLNLIPGDFWIVNEQAITPIVNKLGMQAEKVIPGIKVTENPRIPVQKS